MATAIKPVEPAENVFLAEVERKIGRASNMYRVMAHRPEALERFVPFYKAVMGPGAVDRRIKELVYLTASYANECPYCTAGHIAAGTRAGISEDEMRALQTDQDHRFSDPERAAIRYARELTQTVAADETAEALAEHFNSEQIVEITLTAALANFTNRFNNGLGILPEE
jgi:uncharacterized peroxidase-related enzyme